MKTKIILVVSVLVFLYSTCNPPWRITVKDPSGHERSVEIVWAALSNPPKANTSWSSRATIAVDVFCLQTLCVLVSAGAVFWLVSGPRVGRASPRADAPTPEQQAKVAAELAALPGAKKDLQTQAQAKPHSLASN
jgi:hypothetical protein